MRTYLFLDSLGGGRGATICQLPLLARGVCLCPTRHNALILVLYQVALIVLLEEALRVLEEEVTPAP
jgi:hypothetical protein